MLAAKADWRGGTRLTSFDWYQRRGLQLTCSRNVLPLTMIAPCTVEFKGPHWQLAMHAAVRMLPIALPETLLEEESRRKGVIDGKGFISIYKSRSIRCRRANR